MPHIFVTCDVLKVSPNTIDVRAEHPENIELISVTFEVLKLLKSSLSKLEQLENIQLISVIFEVLKFSPNVSEDKSLQL